MTTTDYTAIKLTDPQSRMILEAGKTNGGRVYAIDFNPADAVSQSAFHRTCGALVRKGLLEPSLYENGCRMNAYELTPEGRWHFEELRAGRTKRVA